MPIKNKWDDIEFSGNITKLKRYGRVTKDDLYEEFKVYKVEEENIEKDLKRLDRKEDENVFVYFIRYIIILLDIETCKRFFEFIKMYNDSENYYEYNTLIKCFKELTVIAKKRVSKFSNHWFFFCDYNKGFCYLKMTDINVEEFIVNSKVWLSTVNDLNIDQNFILSEIKNIVNNIVKTPKETPLMFKEYLLKPELWITSGGTFNKMMNSGQFKLNNKWTNFMMHKNRLFNRIFKTDRVYIRVFPKREEDNLRPVGGVDDNLAIIDGYIRYILEKCGVKTPLLFVNLDNKMKMDYFEKCVKDIKGRVGLPVDISKMDRNCNSNFWYIIVDIILDKLISVNVNNQEIVKELEYIKDHLSSVEWYYSINTLASYGKDLRKKWFPVVNGLVSGRGLTNILGSLFTLGLYFYCSRSGIDKAAQGDDLNVILSSKDKAYKILDRYETIRENIINKLKNSVNYGENSWTEFLKNIITSKGIYGYPVRTFKSILWRKPNTKTDKEENVAEILDKWTTVIRRTCMVRSFKENIDMWYELVSKDISKELKINGILVKELLDTPSTYGGLGWTFGTGKGEKMIKYNIQYDKVKFDNNLLNIKNKEISKMLTGRITGFEINDIKEKYNYIKVFKSENRFRLELKNTVSQIWINGNIDEIIKNKDFKYWKQGDIIKNISNKISFKILNKLLTNDIKISVPTGSFVNINKISLEKSLYENELINKIFKGEVRSIGWYNDFILSAERHLKEILISESLKSIKDLDFPNTN
jgi:hypothetical protein